MYIYTHKLTSRILGWIQWTHKSVSKRRENRAFAFSFFYSMLCLGCLLGSVLINIVRDMMMDGAVILGVPFLYSTWHQLNCGLGWLVSNGLEIRFFGESWWILVVYYWWFISGKRSWTFRWLVLRSPPEVKISWMRMVLGLSSSRSWWIFLLSEVSVASLVVNGYESGTESLHHAASKPLGVSNSSSLVHNGNAIATRCTLCTFYTVHGPQNEHNARGWQVVNLRWHSALFSRIAALFVRDIQILSDLPLKACSEHSTWSRCRFMIFMNLGSPLQETL